MGFPPPPALPPSFFPLSPLSIHRPSRQYVEHHEGSEEVHALHVFEHLSDFVLVVGVLLVGEVRQRLHPQYGQRRAVLHTHGDDATVLPVLDVVLQNLTEITQLGVQIQNALLTHRGGTQGTQRQRLVRWWAAGV